MQSDSTPSRMTGTPDELFKYLPVDRLDVLQRREFKITRPQDFADALEGMHILDDEEHPSILNPFGSPFYHMEMDPRTGHPAPDHREQVFKPWLAESARRYPGFQLEACSLVPPFVDDDARRAFRHGVSRYGRSLNDAPILSLTSNVINRKMWDAYASGYAGFCIGLDSQSIFFTKAYRTPPTKVIYSVNPSTGPLEVQAWRAWLVKHLDYDHEQEWRMRFYAEAIINREINGKTLEFVDFSDATVTRMIVGFRASEGTIAKLKAFAPGAPIFVCRPESSSFALELVPA